MSPLTLARQIAFLGPTMSQNPYENGQQKMIPAVLVYVECAGHVLMIHRASRESDIHSGKWNGLGGKLELGESGLEAAKRELFEESGIDLPYESFQARGLMHFPNFKTQKNEDWLVYLFWAKAPDSLLKQALPKIPEGQPSWVPQADLLSLNLWPGDKIFFPMIARGEKIMGTIWYEKGEVAKSQIDKF